MFLNVRLMVVAVLASIVGIVCALGLFAEFRVSHDSFWRESNAGSPLQLAATGPPATLIDAAATFGVRFEAQPPLPTAAALAVGPQVAAHTAAIETAAPASSPRQEPQPPAIPATSTPAASAVAPDMTAAPPLAASDRVSDQPAETPATKPPENLADRTPSASPEKPTPEVKITPPAVPAAKKHITLRHRPLIARRAPARPRAAAPAQTFTTAQPAYQWAPAGQVAQPVRRRVTVRRARPAPKPAPQAAVSNTPGAASPE